MFFKFTYNGYSRQCRIGVRQFKHVTSALAGAKTLPQIYVTRCAAHLQLKPTKNFNIARIHWHPDILKDINGKRIERIPITVSSDAVSNLGLTRADLVTSSKKSTSAAAIDTQYFCVPSMSFNAIKQYMDTVGVDTAVSKSPEGKIVGGMPARSSPAQRRAISQKADQYLQAIAAEEKSNRKKENQHRRVNAVLDTMSAAQRNVFDTAVESEQKQHAKTKAELAKSHKAYADLKTQFIEKVNQVEELLEYQRRCDAEFMQVISRTLILNSQWHQQHTNFAPYMLGFPTFAVFCEFRRFACYHGYSLAG